MHEEIYTINQKSENKSLICFRLCGTTFPDKHYRIVREHSRVSCIEYIEEGSGTVHLDRKSFIPVEGDSYFLQAGKDQHYYADSETPWKKHFVNISGSLAERLTDAYGLRDVSHFRGLNLRDELLRIIALAKETQEDPTAEMIGILNAIFLKMRNHIRGESGYSEVEKRMKDFLNTQVTQKFDLSLLCSYINRSESQTIRIFKQAYGVTPYHYVLQKKIGLAEKLLADTNLTTKQISEKLCFSDEYYFSNLFKRKIGVPPMKYRKQVRHD